MKSTTPRITETTKFILDSGDPDEYKAIAKLAKKDGYELWGGTTNPTLIAKKLGDKKFTPDEAFKLQKEITLQITKIVPGGVSAEVYADHTTTAEEMIEQGREIASWHTRVVVKLPTTVEGFKARTALRKDKIMTNNTLVFSQEQIYSICLHEHLIQEEYGPTDDLWPPFISPFVGRLDDIQIDGMMLVEHGMKLKKEFFTQLPASALAIWMLEASVRKPEHIKRGLLAHTELITAPAKAYEEWFGMSENDKESLSTTTYANDLEQIPYWVPTKKIHQIDTLDSFIKSLTDNTLDIRHDLTEKGIQRFAEDWKKILK